VATRTQAWQPDNTVAVRYQYTDALGSPVADTDASATQASVNRTNYAPYGEALAPAVVDGTGYTGHVMDAGTGLTYMQQRYYDGQGGRFLSSDPVATNSSSAANFNRYSYANNNPYRFSDPDGRQSRDLESISKDAGTYLKPPPKSEKDWLGPALGVALAGILTAPVAAEGYLVAMANPGATATGLNMMAEAGGVSGATVGIAVTSEKAAAALAPSTMQTAQKAVSLPAVQRYVDMLLGGSKAPPIKVDGKVIVEGTHRYVAGRIAGQLPEVAPGTLSPGQVSQVKPIQELKFDPTDWGNH